ncbi:MULTISPECIES: hypothetical protein [unclassified Nocardioides]|uniref:hypothetical protein n=1 Tax=unclassified Nocardioides TaxID=2615069 RepID=UPI0007039348|nr:MULTISPECIES: hypothetical protein [unclassified Nocardioides]KRC54068.1 hypothetical protein ASE19_08370 [Nocardioides sp. Root79]KRC71404.1 hypothetical protein ASE20_10785 [Nocardioides sp. Root240]
MIRATERRPLVLAIAVVGLLLASMNVLMWRIVQNTSEDAPSSTEEVLPALPPTQGGGSARALLDELDGLQKQLAEPLDGLQDQLETLNANTGDLGRLSENSQELVHIKEQMSKLLGRLNDISSATADLAAISGDMGSISADAHAMAQTTEALQTSFAKALTVLEQMVSEVQQIRKCAQRPLFC